MIRLLYKIAAFIGVLAKFLDIAEDDVLEMVESFMISNQVISCKNKVRLFRQWLYAFTKIQVCGDINKNPLLVTLLKQPVFLKHV